MATERMSGLEGRVVVITGAGRGIGREHALLLASLGAAVVVNDVDETAQEVVDEIRSSGGAAVASTDTVSSFDGARRIVEAALEAFGDLHVVVNNAAISRNVALHSMSEADVDDVLGVNLKGTVNVNRHAAAYWRSRRDAGVVDDRAIVNTSSGAGLHGLGADTLYTATKAAIAGMTVHDAVELAADGVRVNAIAPIARTRLTMSEPGVAAMMAGTAFDPANISPLVAVLAAPDSRFTGQVFSVCGPSVGLYAGWSIADEIRAHDRWTFEALRDAMAELPGSVPTRGQGEILVGLLPSSD